MITLTKSARPGHLKPKNQNRTRTEPNKLNCRSIRFSVSIPKIKLFGFRCRVRFRPLGTRIDSKNRNVDEPHKRLGATKHPSPANSVQGLLHASTPPRPITDNPSVEVEPVVPHPALLQPPTLHSRIRLGASAFASALRSPPCSLLAAAVLPASADRPLRPAPCAAPRRAGTGGTPTHRHALKLVRRPLLPLPDPADLLDDGDGTASGDTRNARQHQHARRPVARNPAM